MGTVSDYLYRKASINKVPLNGTFELSPVCNFACKMCYVRKTPEQVQCEGKQIIPWQKWMDLAQQCYDAGTLYLLLTGGEPFLYPGFRELYERLHDMGFILSINTNGTMIDRKTVEWLKLRMPSRVNVTLYGASDETYSRICGNGNGYIRTVEAIKMLTEAGIPVVINASMIPENAGDLEKILEFGKGLNLNTRMSTYMFPPIRRDAEATDSRFPPEMSAEMYMRKNRYQMSENVYCEMLEKKLLQSETESIRNDWGQDSEFMRCRAGRSSFWINWEGSMTACGLIDFPLKVEPFKEPFLDCWFRLTNAVRTTPVLAGCAGCNKREVCGACVAMIFTETDTVDRKAPYLCQMADHILNIMKSEWEKMKNEQE